MNAKIRSIQWFNQIVGLLGVAYLISTGQSSLLWISLACWFFIGPVATVVGLHRLFSHRSFETYPWLYNIICLLSVYSTLGPTINWVALHRLHHANSDGPDDPHTPWVNGKFSIKKAFEVWFGLNWKISAIPISYVKDLLRSKVHRFVYDHYFKLLLIPVLLLAAYNPLLALVYYIIPAMFLTSSIGSVNVFGHAHGYRTYKTKYNDRSTNSWIANIFSLGDGWHNNHHKYPNNYYAGERWYEWDLMGAIIKLIKI